jgi:D-alanine-D-alanine ligase
LATPDRIVILHNEVAATAPADERDVLVQVEAIGEELRRRQIEPTVVGVDLDLARLERRLDSLAPDLVINLVESLAGSGRLAHVVPALLERRGLRYTGSGASAMLITSNKLLAKRWLCAHGVETPAVLGEGAEAGPRDAEAGWIVKSVWEDASVGLDDESVVAGVGEARSLLGRRDAGAEAWFAERFVAGREINASLIADGDGVRVLPLAEIRFEDFPADKPHIVGYRAKWQPDSFEYRNTVRRRLDESAEPALAARLHELAARCWNIFGLRGYARVDFRVDEAGRAWVLEVNTNPCLSPDAGFAAALGQAGLTLGDALSRIMTAGGLRSGYTRPHD